MLFDLKGRRRRVVQGTYLMLAILMGGGLVLFGIGGDVSGGLVDAFKGGRNPGGGSNDIVEKRIDSLEKRVKRNPKDQGALKELARANYQLAGAQADRQTGEFGDDAKDELSAAADAWKRYLALEPRKPDGSLAQLMVQVYGELGLNQAEQASEAAEIVADTRPSAQAYVLLTRYAALAGQTRKAELAGKRAVELASSAERSTVKDLVKQAKAVGAPGTGAGQQAPGG
jgi:hypothetical protein